MDCHTFMELLDELLAGTLGPSERRDFEAHRASCAGCRDLEALLAAGPDGGAEVPPGLLRDVLERTSGSACHGARSRVCDHVDGLLVPVDDELLRLHLNHCAECAGLARVLFRLKADLPGLVESRPDDRFLAEVLARTTRRAAAAPRWSARLADEWRRLVQRPRFAFEGAYLGSIFLVMLFGVPASPLAGVPRRALDLARVNPVAELRAVGEDVAPRIPAVVPPGWREKSEAAAMATRRMAGEVARQSKGRLDVLVQELGTLRDRLASLGAKNDANGSAANADRAGGDDK